MALLLGVNHRGVFPVAVHVKILVVEPSRRVVPLGHLDGAGFVGDVDDVESVGTAVGVVVLRNGVEVAVGQFVVDQHPVVVRSDLDVDHSPDLSVVRRKKNDVVGLGNIKDFELIVRRHVSVAPARSVGMLYTIFHEVAFDGDLRRVSGCWPDVLEFRIALAPGHVVQLGWGGNVAVAVEVVVVDEEHVVGLQPVCHEVAVAVVLVLDLHDGINPLRGLSALIVVGSSVQTHVGHAGNDADGE